MPELSYNAGEGAPTPEKITVLQLSTKASAILDAQRPGLRTLEDGSAVRRVPDETLCPQQLTETTSPDGRVGYMYEIYYMQNDDQGVTIFTWDEDSTELVEDKQFDLAGRSTKTTDDFAFVMKELNYLERTLPKPPRLSIIQRFLGRLSLTNR